MAAKLTEVEVLLRFQIIHGKLYDYTNVIYKNMHTKVEIRCNTCKAVFYQTPDSHLSGHGCAECNGGILKEKNTFLSQAKKIQGDNFDYSLFKYKGHNVKSLFICNYCDNIIEQTPSNHLQGNGCNQCSTRTIWTNSKFIEESRKKHGDIFNYTFTNYTGRKNRVLIQCSCGELFSQFPGNHLRGAGCKSCSFKKANIKKRLDFNIILERFKVTHGDYYDYNNSIYLGMHKEIEIICPIHKSFWMPVLDHQRGCGCPECATTGYKQSLPGILYYLLDVVTGLYKIGITNKTVKERFGKKMKEIKLIKTWHFEDGSDAYELEQFLHSEFSEYQELNENFINNGATEFFNRDVLNLDKENK